jgi:hypothetical protein
MNQEKKSAEDFIRKIPEHNYYVDYSDNKELVLAIEAFAAQQTALQSREIEGLKKKTNELTLLLKAIHAVTEQIEIKRLISNHIDI